MNAPGNQSDEELLRALARGDDLALAMLAGRHARGVYDFALRATLDPTVSANVTQATFRRASEGASEKPAQIASHTWLYSLALVEILAVANERSTSRLSLGDPRFTNTDPPQEHEVALWAWQASRSLRTRDYCVLDLTLRRQLAPEELADAASLTRNNLYASIGRARGAFEDSFAATALYLRGRDACQDLARLTGSVGGGGVRPALRHQIAEHAETCEACKQTLASLPAASDVFASLVDVELPDDLPGRVLVGVDSGNGASAQPGFPLRIDADEADEGPGDDAEAQPEAAPAAAFTEDEVMADAEVQSAGSAEAAPRPVAVFGPVEDAAWSRPAEATPTQADDAFGDETGPLTPLEPPARPAAAAAAGAASAGRGGAAESQVTRRYVSDETLGERLRSWFNFRAQPLNWSYTALGVITVFAVFLGIAVGTSLEGGGGDAGAVPLRSSTGGADAIDCGAPIILTQGTSTVISFDAQALNGFTIGGGTVLPKSPQATAQGLIAVGDTATSIRFTAAAVTSATPRVDEYELDINWQRGTSETATSTCQVQVKIGS